MGQDQTLPALIQHIVAALIVENESAAPLTRFQNQMDFRIVAEGLKVAHPFYFLRNGFLVYNASGAKFGTDAEPLFNHAFQDFDLNLAHHLDMDLFGLLIPYDVQFRYFLLQLPEFQKHQVNVLPVREKDLIGEHRLQHRHLGVLLHSKSFPGPAGIQSRHGADHPGGSLLHRLIGGTGVNPDLMNLFLPGLFRVLLFSAP